MVSRQFSTAATDATSLRFTFDLVVGRGDGGDAGVGKDDGLLGVVGGHRCRSVEGDGRSWMEYVSKAKYTHFRIWPALRITPLQSREALSETACACFAAANSMFPRAMMEVL
jgi:hypothetical protein